MAQKATATCQLHMRKFNDGDEIVIEPWQATSFPILKDLMVDRNAFDRIVEAGSYISMTGTAPDAGEFRFRRRWPTPRWTPPPASAVAPVLQRAPTRRVSCSSAKLHHLNTLPQPAGAVEAHRGHGRDHGGLLRFLHQPRRVRRGVPEEVSLDFIAFMNRDYVKSKVKNHSLVSKR